MPSILVAADGLWSGLRPHICGRPTHLAPVGKTAFRSVHAASQPAAGTHTQRRPYLAGAGRSCRRLPVNGGRDTRSSLSPTTSRKMPNGTGSLQPRPCTKVFEVSAHPLQSLIAEAREWRYWPLYDMRALTQWTSGRAALVGDAAHPVLPFLAQGAVVGARRCRDAGRGIWRISSRGIEASLKAYERARRHRTNKSCRSLAAERGSSCCGCAWNSSPDAQRRDEIHMAGNRDEGLRLALWLEAGTFKRCRRSGCSARDLATGIIAVRT